MKKEMGPQYQACATPPLKATQVAGQVTARDMKQHIAIAIERDEDKPYHGVIPPPTKYNKEMDKQQTQPYYRKFETGATRDLDDSKLDYEGFLSPAVLEAFAQYMHTKRQMPDGSVRDSDNWQKGIPLEAYMKSMMRHVMDVWLHHRGRSDLALEPLETALMALIFNVQGYAHETLKKEKGPTPLDEQLRYDREAQDRVWGVISD